MFSPFMLDHAVWGKYNPSSFYSWEHIPDISSSGIRAFVMSHLFMLVELWRECTSATSL